MKRFLSTALILGIILILLQFIFINNNVYASISDDILSSGSDFIEDGRQNAINMIDGEAVQAEVNIIYNVLFGVGVCLTVIVGAILGIKLMFGSIEEQAKVKETLMPYIIGCIIIYGAFGIWKIVISIMSSI